MSIPDHLPGIPFYDKSGNEITLPQYMRLVEDPEYKQVQLWCEGGTTVSTVWLGINMAMWTDTPHPFETMVFRAGEAGPVWRYPTEAAAIAGHDQVVAWVRGGMDGSLPPFADD